MSHRFSVNSTQFAGGAQAFEGAEHELATAVSLLRAAVQREGQCWGNDESGRAFAKSYQPDADRVLSGLEGMLTALGGTGTKIKSLADAFEHNDLRAGRRVQRASEGIGGPTSEMPSDQPTAHRVQVSPQAEYSQSGSSVPFGSLNPGGTTPTSDSAISGASPSIPRPEPQQPDRAAGSPTEHGDSLSSTGNEPSPSTGGVDERDNSSATSDRDPNQSLAQPDGGTPSATPDQTLPVGGSHTAAINPGSNAIPPNPRFAVDGSRGNDGRGPVAAAASHAGPLTPGPESEATAPDRKLVTAQSRNDGPSPNPNNPMPRSPWSPPKRKRRENKKTATRSPTAAIDPTEADQRATVTAPATAYPPPVKKEPRRTPWTERHPALPGDERRTAL